MGHGRGRVPYWRLSGFYLVYFATLGALIPYWGLYLKGLGFGSAQIGSLMAVLMVTKLVAPNVWGWLADRRGERLRIVRLAGLLAALAFAGVFAAEGFWWVALVTAVFSFFWNAALPQFEAITLNHLGEASARYSRIRLWGSVGFILAVVAVGGGLERWGAGALPALILPMMAGIWLWSLAVPAHPEPPHPPEHVPLGRVLRRPEVLALLAACALMQASHGPYYSFFSIYLEDLGYRGTVIGALWALGVVAEVALFVVMHLLFGRYSLRALFLACFALTSLRWVLVAFYAHELPVLLGAQLLHAASFGIYHAVAIALVHRFFVGRHQGRGQALYSSMSFGAGGAAGSLASGYLWDAAGPAGTFLAAAAASTVALAVVWRWIGTAPATQPAPAR